MDDYYKILGVEKDASPADISKAFKARAKEKHPDKGGTDAQMQELSEVYEILSDPEARKLYDQGGHEAVKGHDKVFRQAFTEVLDVSAREFGVCHLKEGFQKVIANGLRTLDGEEQKMKHIVECCRGAIERVGKAEDFATKTVRVSLQGQLANAENAVRQITIKKQVLNRVKDAALTLDYRDDPPQQMSAYRAFGASTSSSWVTFTQT